MPVGSRTSGGHVAGSAEGFVDALAAALDRPQPLGWGVDPAVEEAALVLAEGAPSAAAGIAQLVCLREALSRRLLRTLVIEEAAEVLLRATMALERGMATVVNAMSARLEQEVFVDVLTELPNRRAFQRDLAKQLAWANRSRHNLALVLIDLDGLKAINDSQGYAAGDARLRTLGAALAAAVRAGDGAYRVGGDEFVALLPDSPPTQVPTILRPRRCGWPLRRSAGASPPTQTTVIAAMSCSTSRMTISLAGEAALVRRRMECRSCLAAR